MSSTTIENKVVPPVAACVGILLVALLVLLWAGSNQGLGPFDLETSNRIVLVLWVAAPIAGGLMGGGSDNRALIRAALIAGLSVGLATALFPASGTGEYTCWLNLPTLPLGYLLGRFAVGLLVGLGMAIALFVAGISTRRPSGLLPGIAFAAVINVSFSMGAYELFYGGVRCLQ